MSKDILIGIDAGTSVIKAVAFDTGGRQLAVASVPNRYTALPDGGVEQDMRRTWSDTALVLVALGEKLPDLATRAVALAVTGQGDGTWLIDRDGEPVHDGWLWLDARASDTARAINASPGIDTIYTDTGTGVNACQMRSHLVWMQDNAPDLLARAATAFHCKDWLYYRLTGERASDPSESVFTFGDFRSRAYSDDVIGALGLERQRHLLPPILDGAVQSHALTAEAARETGLPAGLPVVLGYLDVACTALGGGLYDRELMPGMTILGSTGVHMRFLADADSVVLNDARCGYTLLLPGGTYAQFQTNMVATINIDWLLDAGLELLASQGVTRTRADLLDGLDARVMAARPGAALFHPYASGAGERGPFTEPDARASFTGLDQRTGWFDMMRAVFDGLALASRDCYTAMGAVPNEIYLTGGAARSGAMRTILSSALDADVRGIEQDEAGAAGAVMIAAVQQGLFPDMDACSEAWVKPLLQDPLAPDEALAPVYDTLFDAYLSTREALAPAWTEQARMRKALI